MTDLFLKLLNMSLSASWLVLAVIALRLLLRRAPRWISCLLWALVAVRLICPFSLESIYSLLPQTVAKGSFTTQWTDDYVGDTWILQD